ncbi:helix-turn-helix domain-containing protein [Geomonas ferrireducens]|uniref:helix-turn-helix domain-containing protein n=1 Tax=Geomonas ferrireducens TaxID=2570227 RepID=UPI0010A7E387|nr:helix-turn-helix domain-containing protein [Geomonas ferrireducens]
MKTRSDHLDTIEKQEIAALAATGKSQRAIAKATGRAPKTIARVLKEPDVLDARAKIEDRLANRFEQLAVAVLDSVSEEDLAKASLQQKAISAATFTDKARLIRGQSTDNIGIMARLVREACEGGYLPPCPSNGEMGSGSDGGGSEGQKQKRDETGED